MPRLLDGRLSRPVLVVGAVATLAFLLAPSGGPVQLVATVVPFAAAVAVLGMRVRASSGVARRRLLVLWVAATVYAAGMAAWYVPPAALGMRAVFPSPLDAVFFVVFGVYTWFLVVVQRAQSEGRSVESRLALVDSLVLTSTLCAVLWVTAIEPNVDAGLPAGVLVVSLLYPGLTTVMFAVAARLAVSARVLRSGSGALLLCWVAAEVTGDVVYGFQTANGAFVVSSWVTATWMVAYTALGALAARPDVVDLVDPVRARLARRSAVGDGKRHLVGRSVVFVVALVPFVLAVGREDGVWVLLGAGLLSFALVGYRSTLLFGGLRAQRLLTDELDAAVAALAAQRDDLERLAFRDPLTGLGNRALFQRRMAQVVAGCERVGDEVRFGLLMLDLDDFKVVNDSLGHETGDALLVAAGERLLDVVGDDGAVTRLGGDEFGVVLPGASETEAVEVARRIVASLVVPFEVRGRLLHTACSVGVATQAAGSDVEELLRSADLAMYAAKGAGKGTVRVFEQALLDQAQERLLLESHLRHALELDELAVAYQPIADARTGQVVTLEVLARWHHPQWGAVPPDRFIPVAEATGMILPIGEWVLRTACRDAVTLGERLGRPLGVAVNVSVRQMQSRGFAEVVRSALADAGLPARLLTVEVTESLVMDDDARSVGALAALHGMGVRLSIDDFGTGHSSLARLRQLPVSELKIDRSLVWEITGDGSAGAIAAAVVAMAGALGLRVVAEGVETPAQLARLRQLGCDLVQGYLLARPAPLGELRIEAASVEPHVPTQRPVGRGPVAVPFPALPAREVEPA